MNACGRTEHIGGTLFDGEAAVGFVCRNWASSAGLSLRGPAALLGRLPVADSELFARSSLDSLELRHPPR